MKYRSDLFRDKDDVNEALRIELPGGFYNDPNEYIVYGSKEELSKLKNYIDAHLESKLHPDYKPIWSNVEKIVMGRERLIIKFKGNKNPSYGKAIRDITKTVLGSDDKEFIKTRRKMKQIGSELEMAVRDISDAGQTPAQAARRVKDVYEKYRDFIEALAE